MHACRKSKILVSACLGRAHSKSKWDNRVRACVGWNLVLTIKQKTPRITSKTNSKLSEELTWKINFLDPSLIKCVNFLFSWFWYKGTDYLLIELSDKNTIQSLVSQTLRKRFVQQGQTFPLKSRKINWNLQTFWLDEPSNLKMLAEKYPWKTWTKHCSTKTKFPDVYSAMKINFAFTEKKKSI